MDKVQRILIFSGGKLGSWALQEIKEADFLVGVEGGAIFLIENGYRPDYALGDFDSVNPEEFALIQKECRYTACDPIIKDNTDTDLAMEWALSQEPKEILLLGVTGSRLDHTLANIQLLRKGLRQGINCKIKDENNMLQLINESAYITNNNYPYISLLPLSTEVRGITLEGFKYPLTDATLNIGDSLGISNQMISHTGNISISSGLLLVIQSID